MSQLMHTESVSANQDQPGTTASYLAKVLKGSGLSICHLDNDREQGPIDAKSLVRLAASERDRTDRQLLITDSDIRVPPLRDLFGYADRRRGIAIVSTARLRDPDDPARTRERLLNVAAHELGHLNGLSHCAGPRCVMMQVSTWEQLDSRPLTPCARSHRHFARLRQWISTVAVLVVLVVSIVGIERVTSFWEGAGPDFPFL
ncbi:MAG TPA: matrixin family metalloprotease [Candidatus Binataceae bacterium]|nr:matrixin family metalloprotease [Candidatus Binataceae bacterium]